ncbi:MAG: tyrosine-type recombinase/integrase [Devosia sp.]|nr:tyrosine-type recombinase/integrase [Devosia sp.]
MPLSEMAARKAKSTDKPYKLADGGGLFLLVQPGGSKLWRLKYRFDKKEKSLAFGPYPLVSIADARAKRDVAKKLLLAGTDPSLQKKRDRAAAATAARNTFGLVAEEQLEILGDKGLAEATMSKHRWLLTDLAASLADRPIAEITSAEVLDLLRRIERSGRRETAKKLRADISGVFRLAIVTLRADNDPTTALRGALQAPKRQGRAAITDERQFGTFLEVLDSFTGWPTLKAAIWFQILTCARPGEVRGATRAEFDLPKAIWRIPAERMKMRRPHEVPLSRQATQLLQDIWPYSSNAELVFPSVRSKRQQLSENAFNAAIRRMGYTREEVTAHGFRATASTILNSRGFEPDVVEAALAHQDPNSIRRAYNRSRYWEQRVALMQDWADLLDNLRSGPHSDSPSFPDVARAAES